MQINVLPPGPPGMLEMTFFSAPSHEAQQFQQQYNQQTYQWYQNHGQAGMDFYQQTQQFHRNYYVDSGLQMAEQMVELGLHAQALDSNFFPSFTNAEQLRVAAPEFQQFLMANPLVQMLYQEGRIEGYADTYVDRECGRVGMANAFYTETVTGLGNWMYEDGVLDQPDTEIVFRELVRDVDTGRDSLKFMEKMRVLQAWGVQAREIAEGNDPTSLDGFKVRSAN